MNDEPMGMTIEDAANYLGVSGRTVRSYIAQELITTFKKKGSRRKWLLADDVAEMKRAKSGELSKGSIRQEINRLSASNRRLRAELDVVLKILDTQDRPLGITKDYAKELHTLCLSQLVSPKWSLEELRSWATVFTRLNEDDLIVISEVAGDSRPWVPYLRLCMNMISFVAAHKAYAVNLDLQMVHRELTEARRRLRVAALCFSDMRDFNMDEAIRASRMTDALPTVRDVLATILKK